MSRQSQTVNSQKEKKEANERKHERQYVREQDLLVWHSLAQLPFANAPLSCEKIKEEKIK